MTEKRGEGTSFFLLAAVAYRFGREDEAARLAALAESIPARSLPGLAKDAAYHELEPLLHLAAENCGDLSHPLRLPEEMLASWAYAHNRELARGALISHGAARALTALQEAGVRAVPLKGFYLASRYYARKGARSFRDLDIFVEPQSLALLDEALTTAGFVPQPGRPSFVPAPAYTVYSLPMQESDLAMEIDIHIGMHWPEEYHRRTRFSGGDLWAQASPQEVEGLRVWGLCPEHLVITTLLDVAVNHRYARLIKFRDVIEVLRTEEVDWQELERWCRTWMVSSYVAPGLFYLSRIDPELRGAVSCMERLMPSYAAVKLFLKSLPPESLPGHRSRSFTLPNLLFFLLADAPRERARGLIYLPKHLVRGRHRF